MVGDDGVGRGRGDGTWPRSRTHAFHLSRPNGFVS